MDTLTKKNKLKKHKLLATGLFIVMVFVYVLMTYFLKKQPEKWMEFIKAFAEAGMVGALADWFAVTALFKYPLGVKIPHTNLITNNKDALGKNLGSFVSNNFLTADTIRPYIDKLTVSDYLKNWLSTNKNQTIIYNQALKIIKDIIANLDDAFIVQLLSKKGEELINQIKLEKFASTALLYLLEKNEHNQFLNIVLPKIKIYIEENRELIYKKVVEKQPILGLIGGKTVTNQLILGVTNFITEVEENQSHTIRHDLALKLLELAKDFNENADWHSKFDRIKNEFVTQEKINSYASDVWFGLKTDLNQKINEPHSALNQYIQQNITKTIAHFNTNTELQDSLDKYVRQYIYKMVLKNSSEVGNIITNTVQKWDGNELSEKLELEVGKDLQYIRINGTLVGGLVGLFIYMLTHLFI